MKIYAWVVIVLICLAVASAAGAFASHRLHRDCRVRIDTAVDEVGSPIECVCLGGVVASCYEAPR